MVYEVSYPTIAALNTSSTVFLYFCASGNNNEKIGLPRCIIPEFVPSSKSRACPFKPLRKTASFIAKFIFSPIAL